MKTFVSPVKTSLAVLLGMLTVQLLAQEATATASLAVLHSFAGMPDGATPTYGSLIRDVDDSIYGTTSSGGAFGQGVVFSINTTGVESVLYTFTGQADGGAPFAGVIHDSAGNLYGATTAGGALNCGTVYEIDLAGHETVLYSFNCSTDGSMPEASLVRDFMGNLYGTTFWGGSENKGVIFKVDPTGRETVLHNFRGTPDGQWTNAALTLVGGNLYGTTQIGGAYDFGSVFELDESGKIKLLYSFKGGVDGANPQSNLIVDAAGNFYGTTLRGGASDNGVVFMVNPSGVETVLHSFGGSPDGALPHAGVILDASGNLYGTTYSGGATGFGTVYKLDPAGCETLLHNFTGGLDGANPLAGVVRDSAGNLYGTASTGGVAGDGVIFRIQP